MRHTARNIPPIALLVIAILMSWLSFTIFSVAATERLIADQIHMDKLILDRLQSQIEHSYRNRDYHWIQQSLSSLGANNEILRVSLANEAGIIIADLNRSTLGMALASSLESLDEDQRELQLNMLQAAGKIESGEVLSSANENFLGAVYPVTLIEAGLESQRGLLWMETDLRQSKATALEQIRLQTIALMIGFTFLALCLGVLYHVVITRRINKLVTTMTKVADGDLKARVDISSKDEFGWLGHYFNEMLDRRQSVESALRQSQKLESIGTLASGIAHDFNNILQAISGYVRLAQSRAGETDPELARYLEKIDTGSLRATKLVQRILSFSRSTDAEFSAIDLRHMIMDSLDLLKTAIPPDIELNLDLDPECPAVLADATQLQQVITNLVTNAVQAVDPKNGVISVRLQSIRLDKPMTTLTGRLLPHEYAEVSVEDNGVGIPDEHYDRLFDPFFTTKAVGRGTGLGLSIVHGVVKHTKGGLLIDREKTDGTRVVVLLPVAKAPAIDARDALTLPSAAQSSATLAHRILLVDDEEEVARSSALQLRQRGLTVSVAIGAEEALQLAARETFDVAVLDYKMPEMNGFELATRLTADKSLPIIIATGMLPESDGADGCPHCVSRVIQKPYDVQTLIDIISEIV